MGLLADHQIAQLVETHRMIEPFIASQVNEGVISYGLSSYGYDTRLANEFRVLFRPWRDRLIDPKNWDERLLSLRHSEYGYQIPPNSYLLGRSVETFRMPVDIVGILLCKSTYIRAGALIPTTILEPGWEGQITLEVVNTTPLPIQVYSQEGIAQVLFFRGEAPCTIHYALRQGKYQDQVGVVGPRIDKPQ